MTQRPPNDRPGDDGGGVPPPDPQRLAALPSDAWAWLLPHVRAALHDLDDDEVTPLVRRLRAAPTSRLAGGRTRRELDQLLGRGGALWREVTQRATAAEPAPDAVASLLSPAGSADPAPPAGADTAGTGRARDREAGDREARDREARDREARVRQRLREVRRERDDLRRQLEGATARATAAEADRARSERELTGARDRIEELERQLAAAEDTRARAVERERRRGEVERRELQATVAELRRAEEERRAEERRRRDAAAEATRRAEREAARREAARSEAAAPTRLVPGRPSRLPEGVRPDTTEAAELFLHPGRLVLVDGYNVTKQHQPDLDLEGQRTWLVRTLAALAARRRVRPTVVFDGQRSAASRLPGGAREVRVEFTPAGVTADDQLVFAVEATDEPVVVVTDDRELAGRVAAGGADVLGTRPFLGAARGG